MPYANPCAAGAPAAAGGPTADEIALAIVARLQGIKIDINPPVIKGQSVVALQSQPIARTSLAIDTQKYNAVYVQIFVTGTTPSATVAVRGAAYGSYQTLPDPNASKTVAAATSYEVVVGAPSVVIDLSSVSGTFADGEGYTVIVTPFVSPGSTNVSVAAASAVDVSDRAARDLGKVDVATLDEYTPEDVDTDAGDTRKALPVALMLPGATPAAAPGDVTNGLDVDVTRLPAGTNTIGGTTDAGPAWTASLGVAGAAVTSANASAADLAVTDAPTAGQKMVITDVVASADTAMNLSFKEETSGTLILKLFLPANGSAQITPRGKMKLATADKKMVVRASVAGNIAVTVSYYSEA
ncbi:MAG: hypothetical protein M1401_20700 [Chloroflexi bacterium]|nr:hypothetical protein [Chloroflexota bacterium]